MQVLHVSAECYPVAKVGGLGDVVGSLPGYMNKQDMDCRVILPIYQTAWVAAHRFETSHKGYIRLGDRRIAYSIQREAGDSLGFPVYVVDIPGLLDRPGIYADVTTGIVYHDEAERYVSFQLAVLDWLKSQKDKPDIIHCHDHHTAFIPLLMKGAPVYHEFKNIPSILTIHNGHYQGWYDLNYRALLPKLDAVSEGLLYWNGQINALACGLRTCWQISTVSKTYLKELRTDSLGLEPIFLQEVDKSTGIVNGIDLNVWNPGTDTLIKKKFNKKNLGPGKAANKQALCEQFSLNPEYPVISFIGRLTEQKGADLLPDLIGRFLDAGGKAGFIILGTGDPELHYRFNSMKGGYVGYFDASLEYNEKLAHRMYAGSDFIIMPSRFEPCGLNQMYAMRYGTLPIVRSVGGLLDTVIDFSAKGGYGIRFDDFTLEDAHHALIRALKVFHDKTLLWNLQSKALSLDFSWRKSVARYRLMYLELIQRGKK
ncbi:MAG: glycogen/starch synthase [Balneolales bacterium]